MQSNGGKVCYPGISWCYPSSEGITGVEGAITALQNQPTLSAFEWSDGMAKACEDHALDCKTNSITGHTGSDGSTPFSRMDKYGTWSGSAGENVSYGMSTGLNVVLQLYLDDGVASKGHRLNLNSSSFTKVGIAS